VHNSFAEAIKEQTKRVLHQHVLLSLDRAVTAEQVRVRVAVRVRVRVS
jgi:aromatic ring-cleaving dioxygenase